MLNASLPLSSDGKIRKSFRRIVTTHDSNGLSIVKSDELLTPQPIPSGDADFQTVWTTPTVPANLNLGDDGSQQADLTLRGGSVIRIVDQLPGAQSPMHRTFSIDYGIVLTGELELELDGGDVIPLSAGDIVVQRGTNHIWRNTSDTVCRIAFILIEAEPVVIDGKIMPEHRPS
jgi:quercetin dioxygenase-like cupin family protein